MLAGALAAAERSRVPARGPRSHARSRACAEGIRRAVVLRDDCRVVNDTRSATGPGSALATYAESPRADDARSRHAARRGARAAHTRGAHGTTSATSARSLDDGLPGAGRRICRQTTEPLVLVSFSTTYQHQQEPLQRVADALARAPGARPDDARRRAGSPSVLSLPPNVAARAFARARRPACPSFARTSRTPGSGR